MYIPIVTINCFLVSSNESNERTQFEETMLQVKGGDALCLFKQKKNLILIFPEEYLSAIRLGKLPKLKHFYYYYMIQTSKVSNQNLYHYLLIQTFPTNSQNFKLLRIFFFFRNVMNKRIKDLRITTASHFQEKRHQMKGYVDPDSFEPRSILIT